MQSELPAPVSQLDDPDDLGLITSQSPVSYTPGTYNEARACVLCAFDDLSKFYSKLVSAIPYKRDRFDCLMFALNYIFPDLLKRVFGDVYIVFNNVNSNRAFDVMIFTPPLIKHMTIEDAFIIMINKIKTVASWHFGVARWLWQLYYSMGDTIQSNIWYNRYHEINTLYKNNPKILPHGITCIDDFYMHNDAIGNFILYMSEKSFCNHYIRITGYVTIDILNMILSIKFSHEQDLTNVAFEYINNPDSNIDHFRSKILPELHMIESIDISKVDLQPENIVCFVKTIVQLKLDGKLKYLWILDIPFHPDSHIKVYKYIEYLTEKDIKLSIHMLDCFDRIPEPTK